MNQMAQKLMMLKQLMGQMNIAPRPSPRGAVSLTGQARTPAMQGQNRYDPRVADPWRLENPYNGGEPGY